MFPTRAVAGLALVVFGTAPLAAQERSIGVGQSATGELRTGDPVARNRKAPYHMWAFQGRRGQRVVIDLRSASFDSYLLLRDEDGFTLATDDDGGDDNDSRIHAILPREGRYWIVATGFSEAARGPYTLAVSGWETPEAAAPGQAASINTGQTRDGVLEPGDELSGDGPYQDRWTVRLRAGQRLRVDMHSTDFDSYLMVTGPDGADMGRDDDGGVEGNDASLGIRAVAEGTYTIVTTSYGESVRSGAYRLAVVEETGVFADPGVSTAIRSGETREGRLETGDVTGRRGLEDRWTFEARQGQLVRIDVMAPGFDSYATLLQGGMAVDSNDDDGDGNNARIVTIASAAGSYTVVVSQFSSSGSGGRYSVALGISEAPPGAGRIEAIRVGQRVSGRLETGDRPRGSGGFQDVWEFDGREGQDVTIEMSSTAFDSYLELRDDMGAEVAEDDDGGDGNNALILTRLPRSGRFRIIARSYQGEATGFYELSLASGGEVARAGRPQELQPGQVVMGRLEAGDSVVGDSTFADVFTFRAQQDGEIVIDLRSGDFDAYLLLKDAGGATLATDDDGGDGTNSRITHRVQRNQTYRVYANSYGEDRATGLYRLTLRYSQE